MYNISANGQAIHKRFFHTLDVLKRMRKIRGLHTFTEAYNINYWNMHTTKNDPSKHSVKAEWLACLVEDFGVSAKYLLTGVGAMFEDATTDTE